MKKLSIALLLSFSFAMMQAQTLLTEALQFHVKTVEGETIWLFDLLDQDNKIVVVDFFSTGCGPCQDYAPDYQQAYEAFGSNTSNVFFMSINWGSNNQQVREFDSIYGLTFPSVSGTQGGGNGTYTDYLILSYPTIIIITPDHQIPVQYIWEPTAQNIIDSVLSVGGLYVGSSEDKLIGSTIGISPNPVTNYAQLNVGDNTVGILEYDIINAMGAVLYTEKISLENHQASQIPIEVSMLKNGLYFIRTSIDTKPVKTIRFVVGR